MKCHPRCPCTCHDSDGGVHGHEGQPCPGKSAKIQDIVEDTEMGLFEVHWSDGAISWHVESRINELVEVYGCGGVNV